MRHLHDLGALKQIVIDDHNFTKTLDHVFELDQGRGGSSKTHSLKHMILQAQHQLENDKEYHKEYADFVDAMSYAPEDEKIDFQTAFLAFKEFAIKVVEA